LSKDNKSVQNAGVSIQGKVISEANVNEDDWEDRIITWVD